MQTRLRRRSPLGMDRGSRLLTLLLDQAVLDNLAAAIGTQRAWVLTDLVAIEVLKKGIGTKSVRTCTELQPRPPWHHAPDQLCREPAPAFDLHTRHTAVQ
mmetsp:Transcript_6077/g.11309  ORF Transcript_6077/g.11309 Transcript_6077/m.11309 type:complete len:100 (+) Transcript_6077:1037-1336(+)